MRTFVKVLLLALVCVAATEVRGNDSQCQIEEALKQAATIFNNLSNTIHRTVNIYTNGYLEFFTICEYYWGTVWDFANEELNEVKNASQVLTQVAKDQNSPEEVFACIFEKTQLANEVLRVVPWTFDRRLQAEADRYYNQHRRIVDIAYQYQDEYRDYYWNVIVKNIKECENSENLEDIINEYQNNYEQISKELAEVVIKLDANAKEFKKSAETILSGIRGTLTFARNTGVNDIKKCLTVSN